LTGRGYPPKSGPAGPVPGSRLAASRAQVEGAYQRLADELAPHVAAGDPLLVGILLGGMIPLVQVTARLRGDLEMDVCRVGRYGHRTRGGVPEWQSPPQVALGGRNVILVDDIFDEGVTLEFVADYCHRMGARAVRTLVLVRKQHPRPVTGLVPDHVGMDVGDEYVFGCGMDYQGRWRHLDEIWGVKVP
jgi:hypoxanthine phosphoribosyltransferase